MQPPLGQPIGFWTARAAEAIRSRTRGALADIGLSQPEWWVLHQLSVHPNGISRESIVDIVGANETPAAIDAAIRSAAEKEWLSGDDAALTLTSSGAAIFARAAEKQAELQAERMQGISNEDFITTITVLQRTIENVGGHAWHW